MLRTLLVSLLLLGIWLFAHPWGGIYGDAQLYALQALRHLHPDVYGNDLFFFSGSQDDYTFFSPLYAALIGLLGLHAATLALLLAAYVLWMGSGCAACCKACPSGSGWPCCSRCRASMACSNMRSLFSHPG